MVRGQEGDLWKGQVDFEAPDFYPFGKHREQDLINRQVRKQHPRETCA